MDANTMNKPPFLDLNLAVLREQNAAIYHWLENQPLSREDLAGKIINNRHGMLDWRMAEGQGLFDAIPPQVAYGEWATADKAETSATMIIGSNLGYGLNHVLFNTPDKHVVFVLEPKPEILLACLAHTDYRPYLEKNRVLFIPPSEQELFNAVQQLILPCAFGKIYMRSDLPSRQLGPEYALWAELCREALDYLHIDLKTVRSRRDLMINHELRNLKRAMHEGSLMPLKDQGRGLTSVILGAGPSLDEFGPLFAKSPGDALYVTGLQTLPTLERHGLKPHLCMVLEHQESMTKVLDKLDEAWLKDIPLVYSTTAAPEVIEAYPGITIPLWTLGGIAPYILNGQDPVLMVGNNVGAALTRLMAWFGVSRILFAGQDFAWSGTKSHADGHMGKETRFRFNPDIHIELKNRNNETIYSAQPYITGKRDLERNLAEGGLEAFNLYGGGLEIKGAPSIHWEEVLEKSLLASNPGRLETFLRMIPLDPSPRAWPKYVPAGRNWGKTLDSVGRRLDGLIKKPQKNQPEIKTTLDRVLAFVEQESLFKPYLLNEIINLAGLLYAHSFYGKKELSKFKKILKKVLSKVREMDRFMAPQLEKEKWMET